MRPSAQRDYPEDHPGRIIYLGDVRRKRGGRQRRSPDAHYLAALGITAALSGCVWLTVLFTIPPSRLLTYLAFFIPLWIGAGSIAAMMAYGVDWQRGTLPRLRVCVRRGALVASVLVVNLALLAAHRWSTAPALLILGAAAAGEMVLSGGLSALTRR